jgi:hypothetical protein
MQIRHSTEYQQAWLSYDFMPVKVRKKYSTDGYERPEENSSLSYMSFGKSVSHYCFSGSMPLIVFSIAQSKKDV